MHLVALGLGVSLTSEAMAATQFPEVTFRPIAGDARVSTILESGAKPCEEVAAAPDGISRARSHSERSIDQPFCRFSLCVRANARSVDMNRASIGAMSFAGSMFWPDCRPSTSA
jgi:hypothetical protein